MQKLRWVGFFLVVAMLGCSQTNARDGIDAAVDTREVPRDGAMEVTRESLCVGLDPASQACAREVLARIDRDACLDRLACATTATDPRVCDVYSPEQGSWLVDGFRDQLVLVRLGRLRINLEAALCMLRNTDFCGDGLALSCGPFFLPTAEFSACTQSEECGRESYCVGASDGCDVGVCSPRLSPGAMCGAGTMCAWGEQCIEGRCRTRSPSRRTASVRDLCGAITDGARFYTELCTEGLACVFGGPPAACVPVVSVGEPCGGCPGPDCAVCGANLRCEDDACVPYARPRAGDPCNGTNGRNGLCDNGTYGLLCEDGTCVTSEGRIGDVCRIPCVEGYCAYPDDSAYVQRCFETRLPLGAFCSAIDQCENGLCCGGVCVPLPE